MDYAIEIHAPNDPSGNPRWGWLFLSANGAEWIEGGHGGLSNVPIDLRPMARGSVIIRVAYSEYKRLASHPAVT